MTVADNGNSPVTAIRYTDVTFGRTNVSLLNGTNTLIAVAQDSLGRADTNTVTAYLPTAVTFLFDQNGNMRTNGTRIFEYDDENQLTRITEPNAWKSEFSYDGRMRRRIRKEWTWQNSGWVQTAEVRYVYDRKLVIQERDQFNVSKVTYTRGKDLSGGLEGAGGIGGLLARTDCGFAVLGDSRASAYYHSDGNGNVTCMTDTNQTVVAGYLYDPFGNTLSATGPMAEANLYRFSSKELHAASGTVSYLYRFYYPNLQRWLNKDPLGEGAGRNLFVYVRNDPVRGTDAWGLCQAGWSFVRTVEMLVATAEWTGEIEAERTTVRTKRILCTDWCESCTTPMVCDQDFTGDLFGPHEECQGPSLIDVEWIPLEGPLNLQNVEPVGSPRNCRPTGPPVCTEGPCARV